MLQMSAIKTDKGMTIDKTGRTGIITDEDSTELVIRSFLKDRNAVWVAENDVLTILGEGLIGHREYHYSFRLHVPWR